MSRIPLVCICIGVLIASSASAKTTQKHPPKHASAPADTAVSSNGDSTLASPATKSAISPGGGGLELHKGASKIPAWIGAGAGAAAVGAGALLHSQGHSSSKSPQSSTTPTSGSTPPPTPGGTNPPPPTQQGPPPDPDPLIGSGGSQAPSNQPQAPEPDTLPLLCIALAAWACYGTLKK